MVVAVVAAAGSGTRIGGKLPKQFLHLCGYPLIVYSLRTLQLVPSVDAVLVTVPQGYEESLLHLCREQGFTKVRRIVCGGPERQDSVANALQTEEVAGADYILVHDAVRPLAPAELFERVLAAARRHGAAVPGVPAVDTIKELDACRNVLRTLPRESLRYIQTPQAFRSDLLLRAYAEATQKGLRATDDAALVELLGHPVYVVDGAPENIKVTYPHDLIVAEALLQRAAEVG
ncbi:MAG: 2-C-methyl-D-erythritol 4-phosphate cytidylyltransferase [Candidatus Kapabacteria bacterium]|nr:2-C-methyl-D-erythritol 4-phosphate cytidylyltransferase [Candidatus Kapabacteria bacterium]MDW8011405.1 2-C-methyl-D-erythritol 4-phosphate cytidylyltransferase [Bacteroidota bacterium]